LLSHGFRGFSPYSRGPSLGSVVRTSGGRECVVEETAHLMAARMQSVAEKKLEISYTFPGHTSSDLLP
jgi:hypothetical protein